MATQITSEYIDTPGNSAAAAAAWRSGGKLSLVARVLWDGLSTISAHMQAPLVELRSAEISTFTIPEYVADDGFGN